MTVGEFLAMTPSERRALPPLTRYFVELEIRRERCLSDEEIAIRAKKRAATREPKSGVSEKEASHAA